MAKKAETPLMKQYYEMKKKHPDALLLFRVGDFYETFSDDAVDASAILGITLTRRGNGTASFVELAGFPHHALDTYLPKLVRAGRRVAICEQLEDPKLTNKLVKRGITELITPGVNLADRTLPASEQNYLAAVWQVKRTRTNPGHIGVAFLDITTGEFLASQGSPEEINRLITKLRPKEIIRMRGSREDFESQISYRCAVNELEDWVFSYQSATERLQRHFRTSGVKGFGLDGKEAATIAAGAVLHYLDYTGHTHLSNITSLGFFDANEYMKLDNFTVRNLELFDRGEGLSLFRVLNKTLTPMGARKLGQWILFPLLDLKAIRTRLDITDYFFKDPAFRGECGDVLRGIGDLQRLASRMSSRRIGPRELRTLADALDNACRLRTLLLNAADDQVRALGGSIPDCMDAVADIRNTLVADPPALISKCGAIAPGVSAELDQYRDLASGGHAGLTNILEREIAATGIPSLKIERNNVFGFYIEVRNTHRNKVPSHWQRKQTLVNAERYITPELKQFEEKIISAESAIEGLEAALYEQLLTRLDAATPRIAAASETIATIDCLQSSADVAESYCYVRPVVDDSMTLEIVNGRHPVIERQLPPGEPYIANSVSLDCEKAQIMMLTGPNMSGKSALLRQTALIALMAQAGLFVPAESARVGLVDKIFTRVGASDNIAGGESTFMVEMNEASAILNNMTPRSLILFDELGRGTSTYDGISIAWAIVEYIHQNPHSHPKTLFATHYHELNEMEKDFPRVVNFNVSVKEIDGRVVFVRRLERGGSAHSFGIHVAKLAGMPQKIVKRAEEVLSRLEANTGKPTDLNPQIKEAARQEGVQLSLYQLDDPMLAQIRDRLLDIDVNSLTPLQALTALADIQGLLKG